MRAGIDLDEVLAETLGDFLVYLNRRFGTAYTKDQCFSYNTAEVLGCSVDQAVDLWHDFYRSPMFDQIQPVKGAVEGVNALQNNELVLITSREEILKESTLHWINRHFPNRFSQVIYAKHFVLGGERKTKAEICDELGIDLFIDDSPEYALTSSEKKDSHAVFAAVEPENKIASQSLPSLFVEGNRQFCR